MLRTFSLSKGRPRFRQCFRFFVTETELENQLFWKNPLEPRIAALIQKHETSIFHSSFVEDSKKILPYKDRKKAEFTLIKKKKDIRLQRQRLRPLPVALQYLQGGYNDNVNENKNQPSENRLDEEFKNETDECAQEDSKGLEPRHLVVNRNIYFNQSKANIFHDMKRARETIKIGPENPFPNAWMHDYETYDEEEDYAERSQYGTPDPKIPISNVPCHGCGALLHCVDSSLPGYLPSELIRGQHISMLRKLTCQRCHFLINYNTALNLNVEAEDYVKMISSIKDKEGLVVLMVDLMDFPNSIWPQIIDIIGKTRPVFIVGNKVDLLPKDSNKYLKHVQERLQDCIIDAGISAANIRHTCLISAQTSYGIEELVTKLHDNWRFKGDVYLIGCTNVGKSTLFNALLRSDYCKVQASSIIKRATASIWPGTTLKMLKFPILRPSDRRLWQRNLRLKNESHQKSLKQKLHTDQIRLKPTEPPMLIGHIGQTFLREPEEVEESFALGKGPGVAQMKYINETSEVYIKSRWCFDTPGVVQPDQTLHLLTTEELMRTIPKKVLLPRSFYCHVGMTLFLAGLGRIDYIDGPARIRLNVFASHNLPILVVKTDEADQIYTECLGTDLLGVPMGDQERIDRFPKLERPTEPIVVSGDHAEWISCCDIVLSSAGWVSVNLPRSHEGTFNAWTPECRGISVRQPALLPYAGTLYRGKRIRDTPTYERKIPNTFKF